MHKAENKTQCVKEHALEYLFLRNVEIPTLPLTLSFGIIISFILINIGFQAFGNSGIDVINIDVDGIGIDIDNDEH